MQKQEQSMQGSVSLRSQVLRQFEALRTARQPFERVWTDVSRFMGPGYSGFLDLAPHSERESTIVDATARRAAEIFSAGLLSGASSPSERWFVLGLDDQELADQPEVREWLQKVEDLFYRVLAEGGFYREQALAYHQTGLFGWQCLYVDATPTGGIRFRALPLNEIYISENAQGEVDTVFRRFQLSARDAAARFGLEQLSDAVRRACDDPARQSELFAFVHAVFPRGERQRSLTENHLPYASVYLDLGEGKVMSVGGYEELPYVVARFRRVPASAYSTSPGTEALADVKMINEMKRLVLEAGQLAVAPPYLVPDDGFVGRFSFEPRAMNYYRRAEGNSLADFGPLSVGSSPGFTWELMESTRQDINQAFFVDLFLTIRSRIQQGGSPTAMEVAELSSERMFLLGPLLVNQQQENFSRLFSRLHRLLERRGELPEAPEILQGQLLRAEYVSPLMLAQKQSRNRAILETYRDAQSMAGVAPEIFDNFAHDENLRRLMQSRGFPQTGMRSVAEVAELREKRSQAQLEAQKYEQAKSLAQLAKLVPDLSHAPEKGSPADLLLEASQAQARSGEV
ncbi:portal protein [Desulfobaculum bizertense]|uniref:portal protein n=1 Tax=Desulfobaculum bizertense TaxID=376490 RepID=UPI001F167118|nr:portal protein [Desulfobaculum bizertense]UIJ37801.1 portal protein [Desulfobaculum bizertense]